MKSFFVDKVLWVKKDQGISACGQIPKEAEFFKDHFPGFPVLPGVLALEMLRQTIECYFQATDEVARKVTLKQIRAVKFSNYLKPGDLWESFLDLVSQNGEESNWNARLLHQNQNAVSAKLVVTSTHRLQPQTIF